MKQSVAIRNLKANVRVCIATCTRRRPDYLAALLDSWSRLVVPDDVSPFSLVVENDSNARSRQVVESARVNAATRRTVYLLEQSRGIAQARNAAVRYALQHEADLLLLADDDVVVEPHWLVSMLETRKRTGAWIVGSPVAARAEHEPTGWLARLVLTDVQRTCRRKAAKYAKLSASGRVGEINFATTSWLGDMRLFSQLGLSFDEGMGTFGGEDVKFGNDAKASGVQLAWCDSTTVTETVPDERLTLKYRYKRAAAQAANLCHIAMRDPSTSERFRLAFSTAPSRAITGLALFCVVPLTLGRTLVPAIKRLGAARGVALFAIGKRIDLYR